MKLRHVPFFFAFFVTAAIALTAPVLAEDLESKATDAVTAILFEHQAEEFATYRISDKGNVDIVFARNTPDLIYSVILNKMKHHPDIPSVLAGKGGPNCNLFH